MSDALQRKTAMTSLRRAWSAATFVLAAAVLPAAHAQPAGIEPAALQALKASTDFLARQQRFSVDTRMSLEAVLFSGQTIEFNQSTRQSVQRPDKLRSEREGDVAQTFIYDGRNLAMFNPAANVYASVAAPPTLEGMLDFARSKLDISAPAGDLIFSNAYEILTTDLQSGFVVGKAVIDGVRCVQLAFRNPVVDMQLWIEEGAQPLPRRMLLTTRDLFGAPSYSVTMTRWDLQPRFDDKTFSFTPPAGAKRIDFLPAR
jgi:hypothetical protein